MKYRVEIERHWIERGSVTVEADSPAAARESVNIMLSNDDDSIEWGEMSPEEDRVDNVLLIG